MRHQNATPTLADRIAALAATQHGLVTRVQLLALGVSPQTIVRWIRSGRLRRIHPGVYAPGHAALRREARWLAAVLATGPAAVASHHSAAAIWRIGDDDVRAVHVTTTAQARGRRGIAVHRTRVLDVADRARRDSVPVTSVPRTLIDLAGCLAPADLVRAVERLPQLDLDALGRALDRAPGRRGTGPLRELVGARGPHLKSWLERRFWAIAREAGLPRPLCNVPVEGFRVDAVWPEQRLVVEVDGWATHGRRDAFAGDRRRDIRLQLAGWRVARFTYERIVLDPASVAADLRGLLRLAA